MLERLDLIGRGLCSIGAESSASDPASSHMLVG
jgi:hypothetical protein